MAQKRSWTPPESARGGEVEHLTPEATLHNAASLLAVATDAYVHQFERTLRAVPEGTLTSAGYRPNDDTAVRTYRERVTAHLGRGSVYHVIRHPEYPWQFMGAIKTSPGVAIDGVPDDALYINDIIVGVQYQRHGIGRRLLRAAITEPGISPDTPVALEGFQRSRGVNSWFERVGFVNQGPSADPTRFGAYTLDMWLYQTPEGAGASHVATALQRP